MINKVVYKEMFKNQLFDNDQKLAIYIVRKLKNTYYKPEYEIISQGDPGEEMYFIANGRVIISMLNIHEEEQILSELGPGAYFGEIGVVYKTIRTCTVKTVKYSAIASLDMPSYYDCLVKYPYLSKRFKSIACSYEDPWESFVMTAFDRVPYFNDLPELVSNELMYSLAVLNFVQGDKILSVGDIANKLMIISKGRVLINF
jgi:CRP-like cAMP-binding protein